MTRGVCDSSVIVFINQNVSSSRSLSRKGLGMTNGVRDSKVTVFINRNVSSLTCGFLAEPVPSGARNDKKGL